MIDSNKLISTQIEKYIPQFIRMEYPDFVSFITTYYQWIEREGLPYHFIANSLNFSDVDRTSLDLLNEFGKNFLSSLSSDIYTDNNIATLIKNIEQFYSAGGSEKSFQFLFRLFEYKEDVDKEIDFYYPSYDMLRISDGKWVNDKSIKIIEPDDNIMEWESGELTGESSGSKAVVNEVILYETASGVNIAEIFLLEYDVMHTPSNFISGETVTIITKEENTYSATIEKIFFQLKINDPGKFYIDNHRINIESIGIGEDANAVVGYVSTGEVDSFTIVEGGHDYLVGDRVYLYGDDFGSGAYANVSEIDGNGAIVSVSMMSRGHDYRINQTVKVHSINGSDAVIMIESENIGNVIDAEIRDFGINYITSDSVITFNTTMRIYNVGIDGEIGELFTGQNSGATGIVEYWDRDTNVISMHVLSDTFEAGEEIIGDRYDGSAIIYDMSTASGELIEGCLCEYRGKYINMDGHISSLKYIQDSYFYQMFSYMLTTTKDKSEWIDTVKHIHPSGTIAFSYNDIMSKYSNSSYGGFSCPHLDTTEFYKFRWEPEQYHGGHVRKDANTQMKQYKNIAINDVINIYINKLDKTGYTFGSEITIE